jgi:hypothetical protein
MSRFKFGDKVRPINWTPSPRAVVINATEGGALVMFSPQDVGQVGEKFFFTNESLEEGWG